MYYQYKDLHQAVKSKKSGENKKANVLWSMKEAKDKGANFFDAGDEKEVQTRAQFRLDLSAFLILAAVLAKALEGLEKGESVQCVTSEW